MSYEFDKHIDWANLPDWPADKPVLDFAIATGTILRVRTPLGLARAKVMSYVADPNSPHGGIIRIVFLDAQHWIGHSADLSGRSLGFRTLTLRACIECLESVE